MTDHEDADPVADYTRWLRRSVTAARRLTYTCGAAWGTFLAWVAFAEPDRLGPARLLPAIILGSITVAVAVGWWHAKTRLLHWWAAGSLHLQQATHTATSTLTGRPHLMDTARQR